MKKKSTYGWFAIFGLAIVFLAFGAMYTNVSMYIKPILTAHPEFTRGGFTLTTTIQSITTAIVGLFLGKIILKLGTRHMLLVGCLLAAFYQFIYSVSGSMWQFYAGAVIYGIAYPMVLFVAAPTIVNAWFGKNNALIISICSAFLSLGGVVFSPIVGGWIANFGYQASYRNVMMLLIACGVFGWIIVQNKPNDGVAKIWEGAEQSKKVQTTNINIGITLAEAKKKPQFWALAVVAFLNAFTIAPVMVTLPMFSMDAGFTAVQAGLVFSVLSMVNMVAIIPLGAMIDRFGSKPILYSGAVTIVAAVIIMANMSVLPISSLYLIGALVGYSMLMNLVPLQMATREIFGLKDFGAIIGVISSARTLGTAIGVPLMQVMFDVLGSYTVVLYAIAILSVLNILIMTVAFGKKNMASAIV